MSQPTVPTKEEIGQLPRWARVAFAARCARRVLPLFRHHWPDAPDADVRSVGGAVELAERAAAGARVAAHAVHASNAASVAASNASDDGFDNAAHAADAAARAARAAGATDAAHVAANAADTAHAAARAARATAARADTRSAVGMIRRDFDLIRALARQGEWTDYTPVPPEAFGDLWPDGLPARWPGAKPAVYQAIPTQEEVEQLPRWARVAFAARCARRVLPLFRHNWPKAPDKDVRAVEEAMDVAERAAATANRAAAEAAELARARAAAAAAAATAADLAATTNANAAHAAANAAHAVIAAAYAAHTAATDAAHAAADAAADAAHAVGQAAPAAGMIRRDFDALLARARRDGWTNDTPVPPEVFGPLWPDGPPPGWPGAKAQAPVVAPAVPTQEEVERLPRWARVAFAARCARRVLPLFRHNWPKAPDEYARDVEGAVAAAERTAATAAGNPAELAAAADEVAQIFNDILTAAEAVETAKAAKAAAQAAEFAAKADTFAAASPPANVAASAVACAARAANAVGQATPAVGMIRRDFDALRALARRDGWTNDTPVPPEVFGPLWPDGPPPGWPDAGPAGQLTVPTKEEIGQLPRWARVAFAARCARRVLPLFRHDWPGAPGQYADAVEGAVRVAESAAASASSASEALTVAAAAAAASASNASVSAAAASAASAAFDAANASAIPAAAAVYSAAASAATARPDAPAAVVMVRRDFDTLLALARRDGWTNDTPVPPEVFGPLWPDGPPPGWPDEPTAGPPDTSHISPQVEVYFPTDELTPDDVRLFLDYLDAVYHEQAGGRLVVVEPRALEPSGAGVPA